MKSSIELAKPSSRWMHVVAMAPSISMAEIHFFFAALLRACGKDTHHGDSASSDGANSARGLAKGVSEHLEGGI